MNSSFTDITKLRNANLVVANGSIWTAKRGSRIGSVSFDLGQPTLHDGDTISDLKPLAFFHCYFESLLRSETDSFVGVLKAPTGTSTSLCTIDQCQRPPESRFVSWPLLCSAQHQQFWSSFRLLNPKRIRRALLLGVSLQRPHSPLNDEGHKPFRETD